MGNPLSIADKSVGIEKVLKPPITLKIYLLSRYPNGIANNGDKTIKTKTNKIFLFINLI